MSCSFEDLAIERYHYKERQEEAGDRDNQFISRWFPIPDEYLQCSHENRKQPDTCNNSIKITIIISMNVNNSSLPDEHLECNHASVKQLDTFNHAANQKLLSSTSLSLVVIKQLLNQ